MPVLCIFPLEFFFPSSVRATSEKVKKTIIPECLRVDRDDINLDLFYRTFDYLTDDVQYDVRDVVNKHILDRFGWNMRDIASSCEVEISEELADSLIADIDPSVIHSEGRKCNLVRRCFNPTNPVKRYASKLVLVHIRNLKIPLLFTLKKGNVSDAKQLKPALEELKTEFPKVKFTIVGDRIMFTAKVLNEYRNKYNFIIGGKMSSKNKRKWTEAKPEMKVVKTKKVRVNGKKKIYRVWAACIEREFDDYKGQICMHLFYDEERAERERKERRRKREAEKDLQGKIAKMLEDDKGRRKITRKLEKQIKDELGDLAAQYDVSIDLVIKKIKGKVKDTRESGEWDGKFIIYCTNKKFGSKTVLDNYRKHNEIENTFKELKGCYKIRPRYLWNEQRVQAYKFLNLMAYLFITVSMLCLCDKENMSHQRFIEKRLRVWGVLKRDGEKYRFESADVYKLKSDLQKIKGKLLPKPPP